MTDDPWTPFDNLRKAVEEAVDPLGVDVLSWVLLPDLEDGSCQFAFRVRKDAFLTTEEKATRAEFDGMMEADRLAERQEKLDADAETARDKLLHITKKGIFDEDDSG